MNVRFTPLRDRVLVVPDEAPAAVGTLYLPEASREKPLQGTVVATGSGRYTEHGVLISPAVCVGQKVVYSKFAGTEICLRDDEGEKTYLVMNEMDIFGVVG